MQKIKMLSVHCMFVYKFFRTKVEGFSLLEVALVLAIMGIMAGLALPALIQQKNITKRRETLKRIEYVMSALGTYAAQHHCLPFPSRTPEDGCPIPDNQHDSCKPMGYLPYRVLGLSKQMSEDAFGHPFHYVVERLYTTEMFKKTNSDNGSDRVTIHLKGTDEQELVMQNADKFSNVGVLIIAENEAYNKAQGPWETVNINPDSLTFYDGPYSSNPQQPFRHSVRWAPYKLLLNHYGYGGALRPSPPPEGGDNQQSIPPASDASTPSLPVQSPPVSDSAPEPNREEDSTID